MVDTALLWRLIGARIRSDWQYRTSFISLLFSQALVVALEFSTIVLIFQLVPDLGGWTGTEVAFMYALALVPFGIADLTVSSVEKVSDYVREGTFDRVLLRPQPALFQIATLEFQLRRVGKLLPSGAIGVWAVLNVDIVWTLPRAFVLAIAVLCATTIYASLWISTASLSFWAVATREATNAITYGGRSSNEYPLHLYRNWIRATFGWGIPLAFVSYVPSQWILGAQNPLGLPSWLVFITPIVTLSLLGFAMLCWRTGIRHYQSTGS